MKTPEEIKYGLTCLWTDCSCNACAYYENHCVDQVQKDALQYIEQLEKELAEAKELAERRLTRKNFYKERATRHLEEAIYYRLRMKEIARICDKTFEHYEEEIQNERLCRKDS